MNDYLYVVHDGTIRRRPVSRITDKRVWLWTQERAVDRVALLADGMVDTRWGRVYLHDPEAGLQRAEIERSNPGHGPVVETYTTRTPRAGVIDLGYA